VAQPVRRDRELDRHRRRVVAAVVAAGHLEELAAVGEDVVHDRRVDDARQEVRLQHELVVPDHQLLGRAEQPLTGEAGERELVDHAVVEADEREVRLRDDEVLVVARVRDQRQAPIRRGAGVPAAARQVEPLERHVGALVRERHRRRGADLELHAVLGVEGLVVLVARTPAVHRVEVERGRPALQQLVEVDVAAELRLRAVHRQVVVDELAEIGEPRRDGRVLRVGLRNGRIRRHRGGECDAQLLVRLGALRTQSREPEPAQLLRRGGLAHGGLTVLAEFQHAFAHDEETVARVPLHNSPCFPLDQATCSPQQAPAPPPVSRRSKFSSKLLVITKRSSHSGYEVVRNIREQRRFSHLTGHCLSSVVVCTGRV
jgi:hypothetical protein